jgi:hypothetical protein
MNRKKVEQIPVLIAGGGPVGLTLALELNYHGTDAVLIERNPTTTRHPKMDMTNGRSIESDGIEFGYRYDTSPVIWYESGTAPIQSTHTYTPSTWPGVRAPSLLLADGRAIFDLFGTGFTLLRFTDTDVTPMVDAAAERGMPLDVVDIRDPQARRRYQRDLVLIRPDQHVAWRGNTVANDPLAVIDRVRGDRPDMGTVRKAR